MMKKLLKSCAALSSIALTLGMLHGCINTDSRTDSKADNSVLERQPQQDISEGEHKHSEVTFKNLMNKPNDGEKSRAVANFLDRQRDFYFIAHGMLNVFDAELDRLVILQKQKKLEPVDLEKFEKLSFQMRIAWEFSERNLHEMLDIYELALYQANDPNAEYYRSSGWIVKNVRDWLKEGSRKGDSSAIISLAQKLDDINLEVRNVIQSSGKKVIQIPSYKNIYSVSAEALKTAHIQSLKFSLARKQTLLDSFIGKEWLQYKAQRDLQMVQEIATWTDTGRKPQALDTLYPDAGGPGHVTGNRFPANTWAITLDDGPHPTHTEGMFKVLNDAQMPGTFFWQTKNLKTYPNMSSRAKSFSFNRASHSYTHANLPKQSQASLNHEINDAFDDFEKIVGAQPTLFRCPYGACGPMGSNIRQMIAARNALHIAWNVDTLDWQDKNPQSIFERTRKQIDIRKHGVILLHDIHPQSVVALKLITDYLKQKAYLVKPLPEIIGAVREKSFGSP